MAGLLIEIKIAVGRVSGAGKAALDSRLFGRYLDRYDRIVIAGLAANPLSEPVPGRKGHEKKSKAANLLDCPKRYRDEVLRYIANFAVAFDNNFSEHDVRILKSRNKISGG